MNAETSGFFDAAPADWLTELFQNMTLRGVSYGHCLLKTPWGVAVAAEPAARLHVVVSGSPWLRVEGGDWRQLWAGDIALLPQGKAHELADDPTRVTTPLDGLPREQIGERIFRLETGGGGTRTVMACCSIAIDDTLLQPALAAMPAVIVVEQATSRETGLFALLDAMTAEVTERKLGAATILSRLADVLLVRLLRHWLSNRSGAIAGLYTAVHDPRLARALTAFHKQPLGNWSIAALAGLAGMSRSAFCERFAALLRVTPGQYIVRWRMHHAANCIRHQGMSTAATASRFGYDSEAAFSRAFKRVLGKPPGAMRREGVDPAKVSIKFEKP